MADRNPAQVLREMAAGHILPRCLHTVAELGVADALDDAPRSVGQLAVAVGADVDALHRVLRLLAAQGLFELRGDEVLHTPMSRLLRTDHPRSMRPLARMMGLAVHWSSYGRFDHALRTGRPAIEQVAEGGLWAHLARHPDEGVIFDAAMQARSQVQVPAVVGAYDFTRFALIGDIGGGRGHLLRAVLDAAPRATGVLFDLPQVLRDVQQSERLSLHPGDFFKDPVPACDAYLLMEVIHDWGDEESLAIFRAIRREAPPAARLLIVEWLLTDDPGPQWTKTIDIHMLAVVGGRQRTLDEYRRLFEPAGFSLQRAIPTASGISIVEAVAA
ncbi:methyltransferase [Variovorax sp. LjRoot84]|uniref:methyltransferase n=1 Tax=Variovorax sp. LjRoot84 TaxID=3342340 RepID=UPI003F51201C